jgi:hypothetical protein
VISATNDSGCLGTSTTLSISSGTLGTGARWRWYAGGCGTGSSIGTGTSITFNINSTTTYFVRAEGACNTSPCQSKVIRLRTTSAAPTSVSASNSTICIGGSATLTRVGGFLGSGGNWAWYDSACGKGIYGFGNSVVVTPVVTTTYYVRAEDF